jgi:hypothetical protein
MKAVSQQWSGFPSLKTAQTALRVAVQDVGRNPLSTGMACDEFAGWSRSRLVKQTAPRPEAL